MFAVSVALVMLEWINTSYFNPSAANLWPVSSACSRPVDGETLIIPTMLCQKQGKSGGWGV